MGPPPLEENFVLIRDGLRDRDGLDRLMTEKRIGAYVGVDPTAPSLHVGHLVPLMSLFWLYINGCHTITLVRAWVFAILGS